MRNMSFNSEYSAFPHTPFWLTSFAETNCFDPFQFQLSRHNNDTEDSETPGKRTAAALSGRSL
jgi:hypothetical protein